MNHVVIERVLHCTGVIAVGAGATPTPIYGDFLATHGVLFLSYAECIQVLGSVYVASLLIKMAYNLFTKGKRGK